jgi:hypothetical protein
VGRLDEGLAGVGVAAGGVVGVALALGVSLGVSLAGGAATVGEPAVRVSVLGVDAAPLHPASTAAPASASAVVSLRATWAGGVRPVDMAPVLPTSPKPAPAPVGQHRDR